MRQLALLVAVLSTPAAFASGATDAPPGSCTQQQHARLQAAVDDDCKGSSFSCSPKDSCSVLKKNWGRADRCFRSRETIRKQCFPASIGKTAAGHQVAAQNAKSAWEKCLAFYRKKGC